eukprot:TRINITY_DN1704_c1_g5_i1.p1 TRINITY_DN1704_c1_g5~~TRINITY_DN1704_c1_g5_i1.p1  ORF type:complete len:121 (+),score=1.68 TRINITY_DN1704_c1_g5_i1:175-537(+)
MNRQEGDGKTFWMGPNIKSRVNNKPLIPSSMAHKFNNIILNKNIDLQSDGQVNSDRWKLHTSSVIQGVSCMWVVWIDYKASPTMCPSPYVEGWTHMSIPQTPLLSIHTQSRNGLARCCGI